MYRGFIVAGGIFGFLAVALGAFAAHALKQRLSPDRLDVFQTGVHYQATHALALLLVAALAAVLGGSSLLVWAGWLFVAGIILFSGSLYALTLTGVGALGAITPVGGLCFLAGWLMVVLAGLRAG
ncbi:MAG: DUF423 domain-containing protein [Alicyclobacillus macrosporangiidus]|uniref:DUF423 domain-containing protein n=1 Tax=Alicyclobacillus macrosporangiidus TaxID=392015 RepID=UPI0026F0E4B3|nr:DUF423 domain-containing protein [Alicyclobacillus macrosporangiidus]MCL6599198.1 DUF423 domain-containing protein [Alicyclobacillus macrosporangiidus]